MLIKHSRDLHKRHCVASKSDRFIQNKQLFSGKPEKTKSKGNKALLNEKFPTGPVSREFNLGHEQDHTDSAFSADYRGIVLI